MKESKDKGKRRRQTMNLTEFLNVLVVVLAWHM